MKINEVIQNPYESLKSEIIEYADLVIEAYKKKGNRKNGMLVFSNQTGDRFRQIIFDEIVRNHKIFDQNALKQYIAQSISDHYFEYKLNDVIPQTY